MKVTLLVLGQLQKGKMCGYDIQKEIAKVGKGRDDVKFGSIYYAIKKAVDNGWVKRAGTERTGNNPERYMYSITKEGKKFFKKHLYTYVFDAGFNINTSVMFLENLTADQRISFVENRKEQIKNEIEEIKSVTQKSVLDYYILAHLKAEKEFLKTFVIMGGADGSN